MNIKSVKQYDYKLKITIQKKFFQTKYRLIKKIRFIMDNFPNYNMYWDNEDLIVNIFFDDTGWDKDRYYEERDCLWIMTKL